MAPCERRALGATAALAWIIAATAAAAAALAQPSVRVSAATRITLQTARAERGVEVTGALVDDLGAPLSEHLVELVIDGPIGREARAENRRRRRLPRDPRRAQRALSGPGQVRRRHRVRGDRSDARRGHESSRRAPDVHRAARPARRSRQPHARGRGARGLRVGRRRTGRRAAGRDRTRTGARTHGCECRISSRARGADVRRARRRARRGANARRRAACGGARRDGDLALPQDGAVAAGETGHRSGRLVFTGKLRSGQSGIATRRSGCSTASAT